MKDIENKGTVSVPYAPQKKNDNHTTSTYNSLSYRHLFFYFILPHLIPP